MMTLKNLVLLATLSFISSLINGSPIIDILHEDDIELIYDKHFRSEKSELKVQSDIPISLYRYADSSIWGNVYVIGKEDVRVYITTNCPAQPMIDNIKVNKKKGAKGVEKLIIKLASNFDSYHMPATDFYAYWDVVYRCPPRRLGKKNNIFKNKPRKDKGHLSIQGTGCAVTAHILYNGCFRKVNVDAPSIEASDVSLEYTDSTYINSDPCKMRNEAFMPARYLTHEPIGPSLILSKSNRNCRWTVLGRPYFDSEGSQLQACTHMTNKALWSDENMISNNPNDQLPKILNKTSPTPPPADSISFTTKDLASDWINRGLGEHASIASFAIFVISLMTNNAPPDLIQDALHAAIDEVDHATASFKVSSLLSGGDIIEPGPLPSSTHTITHDMKTLMERTFQEGCVDETISALAAAAEADQYGLICKDMDYNEEDNSTCNTNIFLSNTLEKIAMDESRHSALAWRAISWGCGVETELCKALLETFTIAIEDSTKTLKDVYPSFHIQIQHKWKDIVDILVPFVTTKACSAVDNDCKSGVVSSQQEDTKNHLDKITHSIIQQVMQGSY